MAIPWAVTLQQLLNEQGFSFKMGGTTIVSDVDVGVSKVRRRYTRPIDMLSASIDLTTAQYSDFYYFFNTTLNGGVTIFELDHPITGVLTTFRFRGPPSIGSKGGGNFTASFELEVMV